MSETIERNLRFLFTWPDATLEKDWRSVLGPIVFRGDQDGLSHITKRYVSLRRKAEGWRPRRHDTNNHRAIAQADLLALISDAQRLDRGEELSVKRGPGRPRKSEGFKAECSICHGIYVAKRSTSRYCGESCKQKAKRVRASAESDTVTPLETPALSEPVDPFPITA